MTDTRPAAERNGKRACPTLAGWARRDSCKGDVILEDPPGPLSTMRYAGCAGGAEVRMIRIDGLGHRWTREEVDTTAVMWQFFKSHRRDQ